LNGRKTGIAKYVLIIPRFKEQQLFLRRERKLQ